MRDMKIRFSDIEKVVSAKPGIYKISTDTGILLKVGIGGNLLRRLRQHRASRDSGLKLKPNGKWSDPDDVQSKASILAKHLYFDRTIAPDLDLTQEINRGKFLLERCNITFEFTSDRLAARELEKDCEHGCRYVGRVRQR